MENQKPIPWSKIYWGIMIWLAAQILVFYWLTQYNNPF